MVSALSEGLRTRGKRGPDLAKLAKYFCLSFTLKYCFSLLINAAIAPKETELIEPFQGNDLGPKV